MTAKESCADLWVPHLNRVLSTLLFVLDCLRLWVLSAYKWVLKVEVLNIQVICSLKTVSLRKLHYLILFVQFFISLIIFGIPCSWRVVKLYSFYAWCTGDAYVPMVVWSSQCCSFSSLTFTLMLLEGYECYYYAYIIQELKKINISPYVYLSFHF